MYRFWFTFLFSVVFFLFSYSQPSDTTNMDIIPYHTIPEYPDTLTPATMLARTIDGLGFRYYWATEGLRLEDYSYSAGNGSRDIRETMEHILDLCDLVLNTVIGEPNVRPVPRTKKSDYVRRRSTLLRIKKAADYLRSHPNHDLETSPIIFQRGEAISEVSHWHLYNGPLADALWHCGQVVMLRRVAGNPMASGVNVFMGTKK